MAKHEFGIMQCEPKAYERFDQYEPDKYNCISVDDDLVEAILVEFDELDCYWHTLQNAGKGLAYCGITLIPPESMKAMIKILSSQDKMEYRPLIELLDQAESEHKFMIHFGI